VSTDRAAPCPCSCIAGHAGRGSHRTEKGAVQARPQKAHCSAFGSQTGVSAPETQRERAVPARENQELEEIAQVFKPY
jgi:hypothetical protein